jgi:hypothetical protein
MILLSFDVGIKNLAYCLLSISESEDINENSSKHFIEIVKWNIIDLSCDDVEEAKTEETLEKILKQCSKCKKSATYCTHSNTMLPENVINEILTIRKANIVLK